jgi:hypothetical protein
MSSCSTPRFPGATDTALSPTATQKREKAERQRLLRNERRKLVSEGDPAALALREATRQQRRDHCQRQRDARNAGDPVALARAAAHRPKRRIARENKGRAAAAAKEAAFATPVTTPHGSPQKRRRASSSLSPSGKAAASSAAQIVSARYNRLGFLQATPRRPVENYDKG